MHKIRMMNHMMCQAQMDRSLVSIGHAVFLLLVTLSPGCRDEEVRPPAIRPVRAMKIEGLSTFSGRSFPGTVEAVDAVELSFRVGGPLVSFPGNELGKKVVKGDLLAQIDARDFEVRVRDASATLEKSKAELDAMRVARPEDIQKMKAEVDRTLAAAQFAKAEYDRNKGLFERKVLTPSEVELSEAKFRLSEADVVKAKETLRIGEQGARPEEIKAKDSEIQGLEAALQKARDELSDTRLLAPFDGSISTTYVDNYQLVQPRQQIVRLVNTSEFEMRVDIPENLIALVPKVSDPIIILKTSPDVEIPARIAEIGAEASRTTRTYPVKLRFAPQPGVDVRPGLTGTARNRGTPVEGTTVEEISSIVVPVDAVFEHDSKPSIWIFDPSSKTVKHRFVTVSGMTGFGVQVTGLNVGEWIITAGVHYLRENQTVRLLDESAKTGGETP
ncbi:efflux RND transporter periplasmic adaptor subunit [Lacunimicrobium album]